MNVLDLFSGIGGFSLGLERAGMRTVAFCEIDPYCRRVLAKHWPDVPVFGDIRELTADEACGQRRLSNGNYNKSEAVSQERRTDWRAAVSMSSAAASPARTSPSQERAQALAGERSGLWSEYARIIGELRPRYVIVENVAALLGRGLERRSRRPGRARV